MLYRNKMLYQNKFAVDVESLLNGRPEFTPPQGCHVAVNSVTHKETATANTDLQEF